MQCCFHLVTARSNLNLRKHTHKIDNIPTEIGIPFMSIYGQCRQKLQSSMHEVYHNPALLARGMKLDSIRFQFRLRFLFLHRRIWPLLQLHQRDEEHDEDDDMHAGTPRADGMQFHNFHIDEIERG